MLELDNACVHQVKVLLRFFFREYFYLIICSGICQNYFVCADNINLHTHNYRYTHI